jgi:hypothetical protein
MAIDTTKNYGFQKPATGKNLTSLDLIKAVSNNADAVDQQIHNINTDFATNHITIWSTNASLDFASNYSASRQARILSYYGDQPAGNIFIEPQNYLVIRSLFSNGTTNNPVNATLYGNLDITGHLGVGGAKNRLVKTKNYGQIGLNAVESTECWFTDLGENTLLNGECKIEFDKKFLETININMPYQVKVWAYDGGDVTVYKQDMHTDYFIVKAKNGSEDCPFCYEIYAKQLGYENVRLKEIDNHIPDNASKYSELYFKDKQNRGE